MMKGGHYVEGKSVLVTGSTSGIGKGIAEAFAGAGCNLMINGFGDAEATNAFLKKLESENHIHAIYSSSALWLKNNFDSIGRISSVDVRAILS